MMWPQPAEPCSIYASQVKPVVMTTTIGTTLEKTNNRDSFLVHAVPMRTVLTIGAALLSATLTWAQSPPQSGPSPARDSDNLSSELESLRKALAETQEKLAAQQREIEALKNGSKSADEAPVRTELDTQVAPADVPDAPAGLPQGNASRSIATSQTIVGQEDKEQTSFRVGSLVFTPGGFVDLENIYRTTNTQSNIATNFAGIPFSDTPQGNVSELRTTAQFSRLNLTIKSKFGEHDITGYLETDFSGNDAANVFQSVNGHSNRLRLFFADGRRGDWEFLGGQTWSWITPNRKGLGPMPVDLALTYNEDQNIGVGVPYTRAAEFRVAYHVNDEWAFGAGIEAPNQFIDNFVALPAAFTSVGAEFDNGNQIGAPNAFPDILAKLAYDKSLTGERHFHAEVVGLITGVHASVELLDGTSFKIHRAVGGGGSIAANYEFSPSFRILANAFWSDGGAHYLVGTGPQVVIRPNAAGTDVTPSFVHAGAGSGGLEWHVSQMTAFGAYYGLDYFGRNFFPDTTSTAHPGTIIGFGGPGSPNTNNRTIHQATFDWIQTFWRQPTFGALQFYAQYSYLIRSPWFVAPGQPESAHLSMVYAGFRYILPSTSGTLSRVANPQ